MNYTTKQVAKRYAIYIRRSDFEPQRDAEKLVGSDLIRWAEGRLGLRCGSFDLAQVIWIPTDPETRLVDWDNTDEVTVCDSTPEQALKQLSYPGETEIGWVYDLTTAP